MASKDGYARLGLLLLPNISCIKDEFRGELLEKVSPQITPTISSSFYVRNQ